MNGLLELKNSPTGLIKDVDVKSSKVTGYLSEFESIDYDNDYFSKGAFQKTISENADNIVFLQQHDWAKPLGKFSELKEDNKGLYFEADIVNTSFGVDQLKLYEAGVVTQHSIGFQAMKTTKGKQGARNITEVKLYEGSAVTLGANPNTPFLGFKSQIKEVNNKISKIMSLLKSGDLTDDTFRFLEIALKQLQLDSYELGQKHSKEDKPTPDVTHKDFEPLSISINNLTL